MVYRPGSEVNLFFRSTLFASLFLFTLHVKSASIVCILSDIQLAKREKSKYEDW